MKKEGLILDQCWHQAKVNEAQSCFICIIFNLIVQVARFPGCRCVLLWSVQKDFANTPLSKTKRTGSRDDSHRISYELAHEGISPWVGADTRIHSSL